MPHTPGPWFRDAELIPEALCRIRSKADGEPIADVFALDRGYDTPDHEQDEAQANANLIAAAPDLLAACQLAEDLICGRIHCDRDPENRIVLPALQAALAKAKPGVP